MKTDLQKITEAYISMLNEANNVPPKTVKTEFDAEDNKDAIRRTLYGEIRDGSTDEMKDIMDAVYNRSGGNTNKLASTVLAKKQFSSWNGLKDSERTPAGYTRNSHSEAPKTMSKIDSVVNPMLQATRKKPYVTNHDATHFVSRELFDKHFGKEGDKKWFNKVPDYENDRTVFFTGDNANSKNYPSKEDAERYKRMRADELQTRIFD